METTPTKKVKATYQGMNYEVALTEWGTVQHVTELYPSGKPAQRISVLHPAFRYFKNLYLAKQEEA